MRYVLKKEKKEFLTRAELRDLLEDVEVKYAPLLLQRTFFLFSARRRTDARAVSAVSHTPAPTTSPMIVC